VNGWSFSTFSSVTDCCAVSFFPTFKRSVSLTVVLGASLKRDFSLKSRAGGMTVAPLVFSFVSGWGVIAGGEEPFSAAGSAAKLIFFFGRR
jgi:hypothetical protein